MFLVVAVIATCLHGRLYLRQLPESAAITRPATSSRTVWGFDVKVQVLY